MAMMLPYILRYTLGLGAVSLRKYFDWLKALKRPVAFVGWSVAVYVTYNPGKYISNLDTNRSLPYLPPLFL